MFSPILAALIAQLQSLSPMPDDEVLDSWSSEGVLDQYAQTIRAMEEETQENYPLELVPYLLESFGIGEGHGVFGHTASLVEAYPNEQELYPLIQQATYSAHPGTRKWSCLLLGRRRDKADEPFFVTRLQDEIAEVRKYGLKGIIMLSQRYVLGHLLPVVEPLLNDEDWKVRRTASQAVEALHQSIQRDGDKQ